MYLWALLKKKKSLNHDFRPFYQLIVKKNWTVNFQSRRLYWESTWDLLINESFINKIFNYLCYWENIFPDSCLHLKNYIEFFLSTLILDNLLAYEYLSLDNLRSCKIHKIENWSLWPDSLCLCWKMRRINISKIAWVNFIRFACTYWRLLTRAIN